MEQKEIIALFTFSFLDTAISLYRAIQRPVFTSPNFLSLAPSRHHRSYY